MSSSQRALRIVAGGDLLANGLVFVSLFLRYVVYRSASPPTVTDISWWSGLGLIAIFVVILPAIVSSVAFAGSMIASFRPGVSLTGIGTAGAITSICVSVWGLVCSVIMDVLTFLWVSLATVSIPKLPPDPYVPFATYGPGFLLVPPGFISILLCSIILQVILVSKPGSQPRYVLVSYQPFPIDWK